MLPPNFKRRGLSNTQNAVLVRGSLTATTDQSSIGGSASSNKKAQGLGLLAVRDFQAAPYQGEPQRTEQLLKELLEESNLKYVLQETEQGQQLQQAGGFFTKATFYFIVQLIPPCPRHVAGETEQDKRDKEAEIRNWVLDEKAIMAQNESQQTFFDYMFAEGTGWLRKRISPLYWQSLVEQIKPMHPHKLYLEFQRVGAITGEINSTIADNQRFAKAMKPFPGDNSIQPHEFLSRYMQASREDYRIPLANGTVFDPSLDENWGEVVQEITHRNFYRLLTLHKTFVNWSMPPKFDVALAKYFEQPNDYRLYSQKNAAIINLFAKQDTAAIVWDGAKAQKQQQFVPRQQPAVANLSRPIQSSTSSSSSAGAPQNVPRVTPSIMRLTRETFGCSTAEIKSLPEDERNTLFVSAIRSQVNNPQPSTANPKSHEALGLTSCNCGNFKAISDCRQCLVLLDQELSCRAGISSPASKAVQSSPVAPVHKAQSTGSPGLQASLAALAQAALEKKHKTAAASSSQSYAGPSAATRNVARRVAMIRILEDWREPRSEWDAPDPMRISRVAHVPKELVQPSQRLADHSPFLLDSGSMVNAVTLVDMLSWEAYTQREFAAGLLKGESCSGESLTIVGEGSTLKRWPPTMAISELVQPILSVKSFTEQSQDKDVWFPALSRGLPFGAIISDASTGLVHDVADHEYLITPFDQSHHERGQPLRVKYDLLGLDVKASPLAAASSTPAAAPPRQPWQYDVSRLDAAEMVQQEGGLGIFDAVDSSSDVDAELAAFYQYLDNSDRAAAGHAEEARCWSTASDYYAAAADDVSGSV